MINQNVEWIWNMHSGKIHFKNESSLMSAVWSSSSFGSEWANKGLSYTALNCENNLSFGSEQAGKKRPLLYSSALCDWYNTVLNCKKSLEWFCEPDSRKSLCSPGGGESQQTEVAAAVFYGLFRKHNVTVVSVSTRICWNLSPVTSRSESSRAKTCIGTDSFG